MVYQKRAELSKYPRILPLFVLVVLPIVLFVLECLFQPFEQFPWQNATFHGIEVGQGFPWFHIYSTYTIYPGTPPPPLYPGYFPYQFVTVTQSWHLVPFQHYTNWTSVTNGYFVNLTILPFLIYK
jgi:hypothetical protein